MKGQSYAQVRKKLKRKIKSASNKRKKVIKWANEETNASEQVPLERKQPNDTDKERSGYGVQCNRSHGVSAVYEGD